MRVGAPKLRLKPVRKDTHQVSEERHSGMNRESRGLQSRQSDKRVLGPELEREDAVAEVLKDNDPTHSIAQ